MRKEIFFAIILGAVFGLVIAFGIWRANVSLKDDADSTIVSEDSSTPEPLEFGVTISEPENNDVITSSSYTFKGITRPNSWLAISAEDDDYIIKSDESGAFEQEVDLASGTNEVVLTVFDENGASNTQKILVVYSTQFETPSSEEEGPSNE
jgi:hypothetical protein